MLDAVLTADAPGVFKTDPRVYRYGLHTLGLTAAQVSFQSSNARDAFAASAFGMRVVWCNRCGQQPERLPAPLAPAGWPRPADRRRGQALPPSPGRYVVSITA